MLEHLTKKILVVEDDKDIRETLIELLEDTGYQVASANNGKDAIEYLRSSSADLILLDLMMPIMDGFAFRREQLKDDKISGIPVVIMSADGQASKKLSLTDRNQYLKKPLEMNLFLETIAQNLESSGP